MFKYSFFPFFFFFRKCRLISFTSQFHFPPPPSSSSFLVQHYALSPRGVVLPPSAYRWFYTKLLFNFFPTPQLFLADERRGRGSTFPNRPRIHKYWSVFLGRSPKKTRRSRAATLAPFSCPPPPPLGRCHLICCAICAAALIRAPRVLLSLPSTLWLQLSPGK